MTDKQTQNEILYILTVDRLQMMELSRQRLRAKAVELGLAIGKTTEQIETDIARHTHAHAKVE
jgi:hypothetical protein